MISNWNPQELPLPAILSLNTFLFAPSHLRNRSGQIHVSFSSIFELLKQKSEPLASCFWWTILEHGKCVIVLGNVESHKFWDDDCLHSCCAGSCAGDSVSYKSYRNSICNLQPVSIYTVSKNGSQIWGRPLSKLNTGPILIVSLTILILLFPSPLLRVSFVAFSCDEMGAWAVSSSTDASWFGKTGKASTLPPSTKLEIDFIIC